VNKQLFSLARSLLAGIATWLLIGSANGAGLLTPAEGSLSPLAIKDHHVEVVIEDGYAITTVDQVFHNPHSRDLEAYYSFPVPEKGAVAEFSLWIDNKEVTGEVVEKQAAREIYEQEKAAGRDAGLTEKDAYRTFEVFVTPVRANADTRVRLVYMQPAHVDTGIGRYVYPLEEGGVDEAKLAFWTANETVTGAFSFELRIRSAYPVEALRVPAQPGAQVSQTSDGEWRVLLANNSGAAPAAQPGDDEKPTSAVAADGVSQSGAAAYQLDRDIVVYWRHKAGLPGSVDLVAYKPTPEGRGTFMMVVTPGEDLEPIREGRDWVFVLDISGSMQGKYATLSEGVQRALKKLRPEDRFRIVLFNKGTQELTSGFVNASPEQVRVFADAVSNITPNGGTNMYAGLKRGLDVLDADRTTGLVLVTDGVANVGEVRQKRFLELVRRKDVRLFTMVMGNSANRPLLEAITRESGGFAISVSNSDDIAGQLLTATGKLTHEALHGVKVKIDGVKVRDLTPKETGSLYRGQQLVLLGHYWGGGEASVTLDGRISGQAKQYQTRFTFPEVATENPEIERLWAFANIERLNQQIADLGEKPDARQAIIDLATEYGLVTDYTSMLVVSEERFARHGIARGNRARVAIEHAAQTHRAQRAVPSRRVDIQQPMYSKPRPSHGGGSFDGLTLLMLLPLLGLAWRSRLFARLGER
jgi:Ca-activated chloride channel family protein